MGGGGAGRPFKTVFALACKFQNRTIQGTVVNRLNGYKFEKDGTKRLNRTVPYTIHFQLCLLLTGENQSQAEQPTILAKGPPLQSKS